MINVYLNFSNALVKFRDQLKLRYLHESAEQIYDSFT